jgi:hypothetical protein
MQSTKPHAADDGNLPRPYREQIIGTPGAFVAPATRRDPVTNADRRRRRLIIDFAGRMPMQLATAP